MLAFGLQAVQPAPVPAGSSCVRCHQELDGSLAEAVKLSAGDIHFVKGLSCHDCHGGDPAVGVDQGDMYDSMSPAKGYIGTPRHDRIAVLCAKCHSRLEYMRKYNPQARVDQYEEYLTSGHGRRYQGGDSKVATCTDCHGAHGIRAVGDPNGRVYPTNIAGTCSQCHSDSQRMAGYGMPTDQFELYSASVHGIAVIEKRDISAPTCNDCHGNHGATPPGVDAVANVCGQCHVMQWDLFGRSPHQAAFAAAGFPACDTCHEHHAVQPTSDAMLGVEDPAVCTICHDPGSAGYGAARGMKEAIVALEGKIARAREVLEEAERAGMEVSRPIFNLTEGRNFLIRARVETHRFDPAALRKVLDEGMHIAAAAEQNGHDALSELAFRRKGMGVSAVIILLLIGLLIVKIRQLPG
ncbi:MAG: cytochrome c3 family protein [Acidobacteriota bacterium]